MDIREKLVELLRVRYRESDPHELIEYRLPMELAEIIADHLIANGVMIQKWIPVSERLPGQPWASVLVHMPFEEPCPTVREGFLTSDGIWHSALYNREPDEVTHWMPMPDPPKKEQANET